MEGCHPNHEKYNVARDIKFSWERVKGERKEEKSLKEKYNVATSTFFQSPEEEVVWCLKSLQDQIQSTNKEGITFFFFGEKKEPFSGGKKNLY